MIRARFAGYRATKIQRASSKNGFSGSTVQSAPSGFAEQGIRSIVGILRQFKITTDHDHERNSWDEQNS
jgi:hypothetical protein